MGLRDAGCAARPAAAERSAHFPAAMSDRLIERGELIEVKKLASFKGNEGELVLTSARILFCATDFADRALSIPLPTIRDFMISGPSSELVQMRVEFVRDGRVHRAIFEFRGADANNSRERFCMRLRALRTALAAAPSSSSFSSSSSALPTAAVIAPSTNSVATLVQTRADYLRDRPARLQIFNQFVLTQGISEDEFWRSEQVCAHDIPSIVAIQLICGPSAHAYPQAIVSGL